MRGETEQFRTGHVKFDRSLATHGIPLGFWQDPNQR